MLVPDVMLVTFHSTAEVGHVHSISALRTKWQAEQHTEHYETNCYTKKAVKLSLTIILQRDSILCVVVLDFIVSGPLCV